MADRESIWSRTNSVSVARCKVCGKRVKCGPQVRAHELRHVKDGSAVEIRPEELRGLSLVVMVKP